MNAKMPPEMISLLKKLLRHSKKTYGQRLITLAVFGSWAAGRQTSDSDLDILIIVGKLPRKRLLRVREFEKIGNALSADLLRLSRLGIHTTLSPLFKMPQEVEYGSLLFLDMLYDLIILYDRDAYFRNHLRDFQKRLARLGARRIQRGEKWYWLLKPDYKPGETFTI